MEDGFLLLAMMEIQVGLDDFKCQSEDGKNNEVCEVYKIKCNSSSPILGLAPIVHHTLLAETHTIQKGIE